MDAFIIILLVLGFVLFLVDGFWTHPRVKLTSLGLACWILTAILQSGLFR